MKRFYVLMLVLAVAAAPLVGMLASAAPATAADRVDAATGATPNYRTFLESDLKAMQKVDRTTLATGGLEGGHYTCLKAQPPYTYFEQDWFGVSLAYLLDIEVGMKADTTAVKFIAADGYHVTLTLNEIRNANPNGLYSILGWKKGAEGATGGPLTELDDQEGPFRLVVPQDPNIGPIDAVPPGTPNWQKSVRQIRAIEVQPVQTGLPALVPESIPAGQVVVYGNILSHQAFTVDRLKSIDPVTDTYSWKSNLPDYGTDECTGILLPTLLDTVVGVLDDGVGARAFAGDGFSRFWTLEEVRDTYLNDNRFMLAWNIDGTDLTPAPGDGPIRIIKPQADPEESNLSRWVKNIRAVQVYATANPNDDPLPFDARLVPDDRVIICGAVNPGNVPSMWYLAEGYTGGGFEEWICVSNPNPWKTRVVIDYMIEGGGAAGGAVEPQELDVDPYSRTSIKVNDVVGPDKNVSATVEGYHSDSITVERAMYWNGRKGGHCAAAVTEPGLDWYLAEGSTAGGFETWITLLNPGTKDADVQLTYMTPGGKVAGPEVPVPAGGRKTVEVARTVPNAWSVSTQVESNEPIVAERPMYWNNREGGTCAAGAQSPGTEWYMAEGSTADGFETWVVVQNPTSKQANVTVTYMNAAGPIEGPKLKLPANSRETIEVAKTVPNDFQVSTEVTSDQPVVAERAVYWNSREGGTSNTAVDQPKFRSFLAEGATGSGFESWITIQNAGTSDATVYVTYLTGTGAVERAPLVVNAGKRETIEVAKDVPNNDQVSTTLWSDAPIVVERAMYWNGRIEGSCSGGFLTW